MRPPFALSNTPRSRERRGGTYEVVRRVGLGDITEVVVAVARGPFGLTRLVTLKRARPGLSNDMLAVATAALVREAHAYARLVHPAVVRLYDFVVDGGGPTLVMEHVEGTSLCNLLDLVASRGERLDDAIAVYVAYRLFSALAAAHHTVHPITLERAPVVHGQVCLENVVVPWDGHVKLVGFGNAGATSAERDDVRAACVVLRDLMLRSVPRTRPPGVVPALARGLHPHPGHSALSAAEMASILQRVLDVEGARLLLVEHLSRLRRRPPVEEHEDDRATHPTSVVVPVGRVAGSPMPPPHVAPPSPRPRSQLAWFVLRVALIGVVLAAAMVASFLYFRAR